MKPYLRFCFILFLLLVVSLMNALVKQDAYLGFLRSKETVSKQLVAVSNQMIELLNNLQMLNKYEEHRFIVEQFYKPRESWLTSNLGTYLFKNVDHANVERMSKENRVFNVMIWKHWHWLKSRHAKTSTSGVYLLNGCNVDNCRFSDDPVFDSADAVVVHIQHGLIPRVARRDPRQIWIFLTDESPRNTFSLTKSPPSLSQLANLFNWSMTYRTDSDVPVPYGRTVPLPYPKLNDVTSDKLFDLIPYWKTKQLDVLAAILISNCRVGHRMEFLEELIRHISVDLHGRCANNNNTNSCPGHSRKDCEIVSKYMFYLVLENSNCRQYLTEKSFHHAYGKGAIPVIMGPPVDDCNSLLPPNSFLHVDQFKSPEDLALAMVAISRNKTRFLSYHAWRNNFEVINEHGFFETQSVHLCRICQALNYNDRARNVYNAEDIRLYLDPKVLCN